MGTRRKRLGAGGSPPSVYGGAGNDVWGWTDPVTKKEWPIAGRSDGTSFVDMSDPKNPTYAGCFDDDGYTHDVQCVVYSGPDERYHGRELCFAANPSSAVVDALTIVDVTDKANPEMVGQVFEGAPNTYSHQG